MPHLVSSLPELESRLAILSLIKRLTFSCYYGNWLHYAGRILDEASIKLASAIECLDCMNVGWGRHVDDGLNLLGIEELAFLLDYVAKYNSGWYIKMHFSGLKLTP